MSQTVINPAARHYSAALELRTPAIAALTTADGSGRLYYMPSVWAGWRRLKTAEDYVELNRAIDLLAARTRVIVNEGE